MVEPGGHDWGVCAGDKPAAAVVGADGADVFIGGEVALAVGLCTDAGLAVPFFTVPVAAAAAVGLAVALFTVPAAAAVAGLAVPLFSVPAAAAVAAGNGLVVSAATGLLAKSSSVAMMSKPA